MSNFLDRIDIITLDMDGTFYDPWHCCGYRDTTKVGSPACRHLRKDTITRLEEVTSRYPDAHLAVLSWRDAAETAATKTWLNHVGIAADYVLIPGSPDEHYMTKVENPWAGQVHFKAQTVRALHQRGYRVVASFDDNADVLAALQEEGVLETHHVEHLVKIHSSEWAKGELSIPWLSELAALKEKRESNFSFHGLDLKDE
jgi:hypothetical protein